MYKFVDNLIFLILILIFTRCSIYKLNGESIFFAQFITRMLHHMLLCHNIMRG